MKQEYDFSKGERGKFYHDHAKLNLPVYLDDEVQTYLQQRARARGMDMARLVNEILKQDIKRMETAK